MLLQNKISMNNVKELKIADISPSGFVCVRAGGWGNTRAKEPWPACNTLSAINLSCVLKVLAPGKASFC